MTEWKRRSDGEMREVAVFGDRYQSFAVDVTDDWPALPELPTGPRFCLCGNRLTPEGRCSAGYTRHRQAIEKVNAA